jgi:hypothetical protein
MALAAARLSTVSLSVGESWPDDGGPNPLPFPDRATMIRRQCEPAWTCCLLGTPGQHHRLSPWYGGLGASPYLAALDKGNGRIKDNPIALFDSVVDLHLRTQIPRH